MATWGASFVTTGDAAWPKSQWVGIGQEEMTKTFSKTSGNLNTDYLQLSIT